MIATYLPATPARRGSSSWRSANMQMPDEVFELFFGTPREGQDALDEHFQFAHMLRATVRFQPDIARPAGCTDAPRRRHRRGVHRRALRPHLPRAGRLLGIEPTLFPGDHIGFAEQPETFAARLREILGA